MAGSKQIERLAFRYIKEATSLRTSAEVPEKVSEEVIEELRSSVFLRLEDLAQHIIQQQKAESFLMKFNLEDALPDIAVDIIDNHPAYRKIKAYYKVYGDSVGFVLQLLQNNAIDVILPVLVEESLKNSSKGFAISAFLYGEPFKEGLSLLEEMSTTILDAAIKNLPGVAVNQKSFLKALWKMTADIAKKKNEIPPLFRDLERGRQAEWEDVLIQTVQDSLPGVVGRLWNHYMDRDFLSEERRGNILASFGLDLKTSNSKFRRQVSPADFPKGLSKDAISWLPDMLLKGRPPPKEKWDAIIALLYFHEGWGLSTSPDQEEDVFVENEE